MGRRPTPVPRDQGPVAEFAAQLRDLRDSVTGGAPTVQQIAERSGVPVTTLYAALRGERLASAAAVIALVDAYGGNASDWQRKQAALERSRSRT